jgi:hypothetical protein
VAIIAVVEPTAMPPSPTQWMLISAAVFLAVYIVVRNRGLIVLALIAAAALAGE